MAPGYLVREDDFFMQLTTQDIVAAMREEFGMECAEIIRFLRSNPLRFTPGAFDKAEVSNCQRPIPENKQPMTAKGKFLPPKKGTGKRPRY